MIGRKMNNRYEILEKIGEGGMAVVYRARDTMLERIVALKLLRLQYSSDEDFVERFRREAQAAARLSHPNVVNVYDVGQEDENHYIVMEYLEGRNLKEILARSGDLPLRKTLDWIIQICQALDHAHENDIVHCDIKPHNVLITSGGEEQVKVTDFGIARAVTTSTATHTETVIGSAHYFSPEQAKGGVIGARSDLYALGVVFYEMVTGRVPFRAESPIVVALQHIQEEPVTPEELNPDLPDEVNGVILKLLAKEPGDRYQSARQLIEDLQRIRDEIAAPDLPEADHDDEGDALEETRVLSGEQPGEGGRLRFGLRGWYTEDDGGEARPEEREASEGASREQVADGARDRKGDEPATPSAKDGREGDRSGKRGRGFVIVILLLAGLLLWGVLAIPGMLYVEDVEVPDLTGISYEEAREIIGERELRISVYHRTHSADVPEGHVISQVPEAGREVKAGRLIQVVISEGQQMVQIPELLGRNRRETEIRLEQLGLKVGEVLEEHDDEAPEGVVLVQAPEPGEELLKGSVVDLVVSSGPRPTWLEMPDVTGMDVALARELLEDSGLELDEVVSQYSFSYMRDTVISQDPGPHAEVLKKSPVRLIVSKGPAPEGEDLQRRGELSLTIPPGGRSEQKVQIVVHDRYGERVIYDRIHRPGDAINVEVVSIGEAMVRIYIEGNLLRQYTLN